MKLTKYITIACIFSLLACSEPVKVTPLAYPQVFSGETSKTWTIRSIQFLQDGKGTQTFNLDGCVTDDQYVFFNDFEKTYQVKNGASKCDADEPDLIVDSNWSFVNASATLTVIVPILASDALPFIVKEVDKTKLVIDIYFEDRKSSYRINFKTSSGD